MKLSWEPHTGTVAALTHTLRMTLKGSFFFSMREPFRFLLTKALFTKLPPQKKNERDWGWKERKRTREVVRGREGDF